MAAKVLLFKLGYVPVAERAPLVNYKAKILKEYRSAAQITHYCDYCHRPEIHPGDIYECTVWLSSDKKHVTFAKRHVFPDCPPPENDPAHHYDEVEVYTPLFYPVAEKIAA